MSEGQGGDLIELDYVTVGAACMRRRYTVYLIRIFIEDNFYQTMPIV